MTLWSVVEPIEMDFEVLISGHHGYVDLTDKSPENLREIPLTRSEIEAKLRRLIEAENFPLKEVAARLEMSLSTVRRVCRTLELGTYSKKEKGGQVSRSSQVPFGWALIGGRLFPNRDEVRWVQYMRTLRQKGMSFSAIALKLAELQVPTKNGRKWHARTVWRILRITGA